MSTPEGQSAPEKRGAKEPRSRSEQMRSIGLLALAVLITIFAVLNTEKVSVDWIVGSGHAPLIIVIAISVLVGVVLAYLAERRNRKRR